MYKLKLQKWRSHRFKINNFQGFFSSWRPRGYKAHNVWQGDHNTIRETPLHKIFSKVWFSILYVFISINISCVTFIEKICSQTLMDMLNANMSRFLKQSFLDYSIIICFWINEYYHEEMWAWYDFNDEFDDWYMYSCNFWDDNRFHLLHVDSTPPYVENIIKGNMIPSWLLICSLHILEWYYSFQIQPRPFTTMKMIIFRIIFTSIPMSLVGIWSILIGHSWSSRVISWVSYSTLIHGT